MYSSNQMVKVLQSRGIELTRGAVLWHARRGRIGQKVGTQYVFEDQDVEKIREHMGRGKYPRETGR